MSGSGKGESGRSRTGPGATGRGETSRGETSRAGTSSAGRMSKTSTRLLVAVLCGLVGFAVVTQARQRPTDGLAGLRQTELVRILDEMTTRVDDLTTERNQLRAELNELESGVTSHTAALRAAEDRQLTLSIQAGVIPVRGPGIELTVNDPDGKLTAQSFVSLVEELRNSGAEAIEINSVRLGTNSWLVGEGEQISLDGTAIRSPYAVRAIGNADTMSVALEMPGGVLAAFRTAGATTALEEFENVEIWSVRPLAALEYATVVG